MRACLSSSASLCSADKLKGIELAVSANATIRCALFVERPNVIRNFLALLHDHRGQWGCEKPCESYGACEGEKQFHLFAPGNNRVSFPAQHELLFAAILRA